MYFLVVLLVLLYTCQSLFCRLYTAARGGSGATQFSVCYAAFAGICTLAVNGFAYAPSGQTVVLGLINAMMLLCYNIAMVRCGSLGSYAFMMICSLSGGILVPMLYDALYLQYVFSPLQLVAIALMLVSFVVMNLEGVRSKKNGRYLVWCGILFLSNGLYGVLLNLQQTLMQFTQRNEMIITTYLGMAVLTGIFQLLVNRKAFIEGFRMDKRALVTMMLSALCATVAVNMLMYVMQLVNITVLSVLDNGGVLVLSAVCAFTLFKEKLTMTTLAGIVLACLSIVMLSV